MIYSIPSTTRLLVAEPLGWFALLSNRSNFELNSFRFENPTALRKFENRGIEVSRNQLLCNGQQKSPEMEGSCTRLLLSRLQSFSNRGAGRSMSCAAPSAPSLSTPTAAKVTPTPIPREMTAEEIRPKRNVQKLKIRGLCCMNSDDTKMMDSRSFEEKCATWFDFGTLAVFSNKMQLDYISKNG